MTITHRRNEWKLDEAFHSGVELIGRDIEHVVDRIGPYTFYGSMDHGHEVAQWKTQRFRVEVWFKDGRCTEILIRK